MKPLIPKYVSLSVLLLLHPSIALADGIQEVRAELADSTVADAAMMALRLCNTGQSNVCPQAAALLCLDGQGSIVSEIMDFGVSQDQIVTIIKLLAFELESRDAMLMINETCKKIDEGEVFIEGPKIIT